MISLPSGLSSTAETSSLSESSAPEQKLLLPENSRPPSTRFATVRLSSGFKALPQNQPCLMVSLNQDCHCSWRPNRRTEASCR